MLYLLGIILVMVWWFFWACLGAIACLIVGFLPFYLYNNVLGKYTFNNLINTIAKIPVVGWLLAFLADLPFTAIGICIAAWSTFQSFCMCALFYGGCGSDMPQIINSLNRGTPHLNFLLEFFYEHMQWLWGMGLFGGTTPFNNGVWCEANGEGSTGIVILKVLVMIIPAVVGLTLPWWVFIMALVRPIQGAMGTHEALVGKD